MYFQALLDALDNAVNEEEQQSAIMYIAFAENPQPQMVSHLESMIDSNSLSADPLLLAYGALISKASPELQNRMTLFLLKRLPRAETNSSSLIHLLLSLGNTESPHVTGSIVDYLQHPELDVQLSAIYALRYMTNDSLVQKALTAFLSQPDMSEDHLAVVTQSLLYGIEHAQNNYQEKPFSNELATVLALSAIDMENAELHFAIVDYIKSFDTPRSKQLVELLKSARVTEFKDLNNGTRFTRGTNWAESNSVYDLVQPLSTRSADVKQYGYRKSYIWGKKFGVNKGNVQIAAGGFIGVSRAGDYKLFGGAKAVGHAFGKTKTALDLLVLREKSSRSTRSKLYANIIGKTLINVDVTQESSVCMRHSKPLYSSKSYQLFSLQLSVFIYVGTLKFSLSGYVKLNTDMYVQFCENRGSITAAAGLTPTITMTLSASGTANILVS